MSPMQRDLSRKLQTRLGEVLEREMNIARHVLQPDELGMMLVESAVMMARTAAATMGGMVDDEADARKLFGFALDRIVEQINRERSQSADKMVAQMQARSRQ